MFGEEPLIVLLGDNMKKIHPKEIKIEDERFRQDMGDVKALAVSIKKHGQIQPIVVTKDLVLVAGGRRLAACTMLGQEISYVLFDDLSSLQRRTLELEENISRKDFTPAEESLAIAELHRLKQEEFGVNKAGRPKKSGKTKWALEDTAAMLGVNKMTISRHLKAAEAIGLDPDLKKAKTQQEIRSAMRGRLKLQHKAIELAKRQETSPTMMQANKIVRQGDGLKRLAEVEKGSVDVLLTDPPYGIDLQNHTAGKFGLTGFKFNDSIDGVDAVYAKLAELSFHACSNLAYAVVFCPAVLLNTVQKDFSLAGWDVWPRPLIWIKESTGQSNNPDRWPASCYELAIIGRKSNAHLHNYPIPDWIQFPPVLGDARSHIAEKPLDLMKWILSHVGFPKARVFDPFAGSFVTAQAALELDMFPECWDLLPECWLIGKARVAETLERLNT